MAVQVPEHCAVVSIGLRNPPWLKSVAHRQGEVGGFGAKRPHVTCPGAEWDEGGGGEVAVGIQDVHRVIGLVHKLSSISLLLKKCFTCSYSKLDIRLIAFSTSSQCFFSIQFT